MNRYIQLIRLVLLMLSVSLGALAQTNDPTNLVASAQTSTSIRLTWTDNVTNETGFEIERSTDNRTFTKIADAAANATSFTVTGLTPVTLYYFRARSKFATGATSVYSNVANATTLSVPPVVNNLSASAAGTTSIQLNWTDVGKEAQYFIERRVGQSGNFTRIATTGVNYKDNNLAPGTEYCYRVQYAETAEAAGYSNIACATTSQTAPTAPARLAANVVSSTQIDLQWADLSSNETGFEVERASAPGGPFTKIADLGINTQTYSDRNLTPNTQYCYRVQAKNSAGGSGFSTTVCGTTQPIPVPTSPNNLAAVAASSTQINLNWTDRADNETGFEVERAEAPGGPFTKIADLGINTQTYSDQNLTPNKQYCYRVQAKNSSGGSGFSNTACATTPAPPVPPPAAPTNLAAVAVSSSQINLSWTDNATNETGFELERSTDGSNFTKIADIPANTTAFSNTGLNPATRYYYRVRTVNQGGASGYSNTADATTTDVAPNAPARLAAQSTSFSSIALSWADLSGNETGFQLERSNSATGTFAKIADLGPNTTTYTDNGLSGSTQYCYRIRAINAIGASAYSDVACATTPAAPVPPPTAPTVLAAVATSAAQINLSWTDNATTETGYEVERSADGTNFAKIADLPTNTTTFSSTGLTPATTYYYRVRAVNQGGASGYSNTANATTADVAPTAPARLTATAVSPSQINLSWADLSGNETGFQMERSTDGINFIKIADLGANITTYQNTGLTFLTKYYYRVRAINAIGPSGYSNIADATTLPPPVPVAPQSLTAQANDFDRIQVTWGGNPDNPSGYVLERSTSPTGTFSVVADLAGNVNTFQDTGLQELTTYYYRVRAKNVSGFSPYSNVASAKTEEMVVAVRKEPTVPLWQVIQLTDEALIQFAPDISGVVPITIYDLQGRPRLALTVRILANRQVSVSIANLPGNLYILTAETNKGLLKHKLMKP